MINPTLLNLPMPITTPRLILRPPQVGDGAILHAAIVESFEELHRFMPWAKELQSIEQTEEYVRHAAANWIVKRAEDPYLPLLIFDRSTEELIGATGYHHINWDVPCLETGYWLRTSRTGEGLMTEAVNAQTRYAFEALKINRIAITCDITNIRSKSIPERLGFHLEGTLKNNRLAVNGSITDTLVFARYNLDGLPPLEITY